MLGNKLKEGRNSSGITQEQLAERLGLSQSSISNYERNQRIPKKEYRAKICLMLDCSIISLLGIQSKNKTSEVKEIITTEEEKSIIFLIKEWFLKNKLLLSQKKNRKYYFLELQTALKKALPTMVTEARVDLYNNAYWVCPNCRITFEREYQSYCDRCGQKLKWGSLKNIKYIKSKERR